MERKRGGCLCTTYGATLKNSEASKYHKHDPCCGQLYVRVLCPRVSNQISTAGWYSTSLPLGDSEWKKREKGGRIKGLNAPNGEKLQQYLIWLIIYCHHIYYEQCRREEEKKAERLMLGLIRLTWNRLISLGFPAVFKQF